MMVKKNVLDSDWSGFSLPDSYEQNEITLCTSYLQISPSSIPPILISENVTNALVTQRCFKNHYDNEDLSFWSTLNRDSTAYLQETYFPNEGKFFFHFFCNFVKKNFMDFQMMKTSGIFLILIFHQCILMEILNFKDLKFKLILNNRYN